MSSGIARQLCGTDRHLQVVASVYDAVELISQAGSPSGLRRAKRLQDHCFDSHFHIRVFPRASHSIDVARR
jgi:hypothetical protein